MELPPQILVLEAEPDTLGFALYDAAEPVVEARFRGAIRELGAGARFDLEHCPDGNGGSWRIEAGNPAQAVEELLRWLEQHPARPRLAAAGHRLIHGGELFTRPVPVNSGTLRQMDALVALAPVLLPPQLEALRTLIEHRPGIPQVACFDTAFHHDLPMAERHYAVPHAWQDLGVRRYGFDGLACESIAEALPERLGRAADGRIVVVHLGRSASLCALHGRRSVAVTTGFSPLDGVPMATRSGAVDPGALLYLLDQGVEPRRLARELHFESGLKGLSGLSGDLRTLLASRQPAARLAVDHFLHWVHRALGAMAAALGGLDALVFTAGIGENAPRIRRRLCDLGNWLGLELDDEANLEGRGRISPPHARPSVWVIASDPAAQVARHTMRLTAPLIEETRPHG